MLFARITRLNVLVIVEYNVGFMCCKRRRYSTLYVRNYTYVYITRTQLAHKICRGNIFYVSGPRSLRPSSPTSPSSHTCRTNERRRRQAHLKDISCPDAHRLGSCVRVSICEFCVCVCVQTNVSASAASSRRARAHTRWITGISADTYRAVGLQTHTHTHKHTHTCARKVAPSNSCYRSRRAAGNADANPTRRRPVCENSAQCARYQLRQDVERASVQ